MIDCIEFNSAGDFLKKCEDFMLHNESENNLVIGLADAMNRQMRDFNAPLYFALIENDNVIGAALRTDEQRPLAITRMNVEAVEQLCSTLKFKDIALAGVVGEEVSSKNFSKCYCFSIGVTSTLGMYQGVYETDKIKIPKNKVLKMHLARKDNLEVTAKFMAGFINDCFPSDKNVAEKSKKMARRHIKNQSSYLLVNEQNDFVSMAANNRETRNTACISWVYTPPQFRMQGYGAMITALVSQKMLDSGKKRCNLFTDLKNPTSNSIYKKIGYKMIGKSKQFEFQGAK